jgi:SAM-dependent methyltransferase
MRVRAAACLAQPELLMPYDFGPRDAACFPARCAELVAKHASVAAEDGAPLCALDVGCAVGGASFELARTFDAVVGLDFSHAFVHAAKRLQARACTLARMLRFRVAPALTRTHAPCCVQHAGRRAPAVHRGGGGAAELLVRGERAGGRGRGARHLPPGRRVRAAARCRRLRPLPRRPRLKPPLPVRA